MRNFLVIGGISAVALLGGVAYYFYEPAVPPPPKDAAANLPAEFRKRITPEQLAMLRGERTSAPLVTAAQAASIAEGVKVESVAPTESGLAVSLSGDKGQLQGKLTNNTEAEIVYNCPAGTLFTNASSDVVALRDSSSNVAPKSTSDIVIPVAATRSANSVLAGSFQQQAGSLDALAPLLAAVASNPSLSQGAMQTAVLAITENVPLEMVARFPSPLPDLSADFDAKQPLRVSNADLIAALSLLKSSGIDMRTISLMQEPQLKIMAMLDPDSHDAAKAFYGITDQAEWSFWKNQLTAGDPSLRHVALYGIARYYPEVALKMLPRWVQAVRLNQTYRVAAAGALNLVDDARATEQLQMLKQEVTDDSSVQQAIQRAIAH